MEMPDLVVLMPKSCRSCGMDIVAHVDGGGDPWLQISLSPGIDLFCCPVCGTTQVNMNAAENYEKVKKIMEDRNRLVIPARN